MKPLPKKDPPNIGGGIDGSCVYPPITPTNSPFPPPDIVQYPDGTPCPSPYDPIPPSTTLL